MVSLQESGTIKIYRQTPTGSRVHLFSGDVAQLGPSGSPDGAIGSTPEKWSFIPLQNAPNKVLRANDQMVITFVPRGADTLDASDSRIVLPITYQDGTSDTLGDPTSSVDWDVLQMGDLAVVAGVEVDLCKRKVLQSYALGSNIQKSFISIEDDTA